MTIDSLALYNTEGHKIKLTDKNGDVVEGFVILYESECDSGYDEACIGLDIGLYIRQSEIKTIEILD